MKKRRPKYKCTPPPGRTNSWFEYNTEPLWEKHLLPLAGKIQTYLELGVCEGASMCWVRKNLQPEKIVGVDHYQPPREKQRPTFEQYKRNVLKNLGMESLLPMMNNGDIWLSKDEIELFIMNTREFFTDGYAKGSLKPQSVDLVFVDAGHYAWDVVEDFALVWPFVKRKGLLVFDDLQRWVHGGKPLVRIGVRAAMAAWEGRWEKFYEQGRHLCLRKLK